MVFESLLTIFSEEKKYELSTEQLSTTRQIQSKTQGVSNIFSFILPSKVSSKLCSEMIKKYNRRDFFLKLSKFTN